MFEFQTLFFDNQKIIFKSQRIKFEFQILFFGFYRIKFEFVLVFEFQRLSLNSYEADIIQSLLSTGKKHLASRFNLTYRYIDDVLSINNPEFQNYLCQMYPAELEIKDTTESTTSASYLDLLLSIGRDDLPNTSIYDKRDDFNFHITNFPFLSSNIPSLQAYDVFISQLIWYARGLLLVWIFYSDGLVTFQ